MINIETKKITTKPNNSVKDRKDYISINQEENKKKYSFKKSLIKKDSIEHTKNIIKQLSEILTNKIFSEIMEKNMFTSQKEYLYKDILYKEYSKIISSKLQLQKYISKINDEKI